ncbi:hypothetical protein ACS0TY_016906 [Phlomoides rotata]
MEAFQDCLGTLDGTLIDVTVPKVDKARYRTRKRTILINALAACDRSMRFIYMLTGWEGLVANARILEMPCVGMMGSKCLTFTNIYVFAYPLWFIDRNGVTIILLHKTTMSF